MRVCSSRIIQFGMASAVWLFSAGCYGSGVSTGVYVGVSGPGPWYGHPGPYGYRGPYGYPGRVGGGVVIGYPCCDEEDADDRFDAASAFDGNDDSGIHRDRARIDRLRERWAAGVQVLDFETQLETLQRQDRRDAGRHQ